MNNNETMSNQNNINELNKKTLPAQATGEQIEQHQERTRNKYQSEFNVYHDKEKLDKNGKIILFILAIVFILIIIIMIF